MTLSELCSYGPYLGLSVAHVSIRMRAVSVGGTARGNCLCTREASTVKHDNSDDREKSVDEDAAAPDQPVETRIPIGVFIDALEQWARHLRRFERQRRNGSN